ncbi:hypothetical protein HYH03_009726 [Edaphochlamys debaryana]|uniref:ABC transporter domain-containing protein n=1 Tax=Edaphochlamys debaryana TaxID=47281 RepID=A0A836BWS7_9CHLO|nr:hypothetical protein HYH03_009726 [Edaphochlamys debaryana]|eukprot:KAG2491996.1 hypothetical protein HYH03_009726 [Edaphochlamys debaryana]
MANAGDSGADSLSLESPVPSTLPRIPTRGDLNKVIAAITDGERDNFKIVSKLNDRMQRAGLTMPGVEVRWTDLHVELTDPPRPVPQALRRAGSAISACLRRDSAKEAPPTVPLITPPAGKAPAGTPSRPPPNRVILDAGSGVLRPGRMTLLLGPPGSGRSTLLKALAGQLVPPTEGAASAALAAARCVGRGADPAATVVRRHGRIKVQGSVLYNGKPADGSAFEITRAATYVGQTENHLPELTVAETLNFAAECQGPGIAKWLHRLLVQKEAEAGLQPNDPHLALLLGLSTGPAASRAVVQAMARMLAIDNEHVMDTVVGNDMLKGISGGQKRRVTVGEMAVGLSNVMMMDEITNGLDAQSALAITRSLRNMCEQSNVTIMTSLLQPSPEVVSCFHDVLLLSAGRIVFHGPVEALQGFFGGLGLAPLPQQTLADFAQEVVATPEDQARFRVQALPGAPVPAWTGHKWVSPRRMRRRFEESEEGRAQAALVAQPPYTHELEELVLRKSKYGTSTWRMWATVLAREALLWKRGKAYLAGQLFSALFNAFLVATAFANLSHDTAEDANLYISALFFTYMALYASGFNFTPIYCSRLPVFYKQRDHRFYSAASYAVANMVMRLPEILLSAAFIMLVIYWSVDFVNEAGRFFIMFLDLVCAGVYSQSTFQLLSALLRNESMTQGLGAVIMVCSLLVSGFPIASSNIPGWWIWVHWLTPMSWGYRSMLITEMSSSNWPMGPNGLTVGQEQLAFRGFKTDWSWVWGGVGYVLGFSLLQVALQAVALAQLGPLRSWRGPEYENDDEGEEPRRISLQLVRSSLQHIIHHLTPHHPHAPAHAEAGGHSPSRAQLPSAAAAPSPVESAAIITVGKGSSATAAATHANGLGGSGQVTEQPRGSMSFRPVVMAFKEVCYFVTPAKEELQLLDRVSGVFEPGVLTSLMGASGAGKTTLMDVLAGRKTGGRMSGLQLVNGAPKRMSKFARQMGYVEQVDVHNPFTTVEEALIFSARLRVGSDLLPDDKLREFVRDMMEVVELTPLADRLVGAPGTGGLSTEARKRLTIAVELVANPSIVFMDEPTSGLDGRAAGMVMRAVRNTVATGRTVVCTIHQPNREIMDAFDQLLLLKPGGRTIYFGPLGPQQALLVAYLSSLPGVGGYEPHMNPANWMLEVTSPEAEANLGTDFAVIWQQSEAGRRGLERVERYVQEAQLPAAKDDAKGRKHLPKSPSYGGDVELGTHPAVAAGAGGGAGEAEPEAEAEAEEAGSIATRYAQPAHRQLWLLVKRGLITNLRNTTYTPVKFAITLLFAWIVGSLYWERGEMRDSVVGVLDIMGVMYTASTFIAMTNMMMIMPVLCAERAVFYREKASGMYRPSVFAAAQALAEYPFTFLQSVLFVIIVYTTVHFEFTSAKALWFWLFFWLIMNVFTCVGMAAMNSAPELPAAIAMVMSVVLLWMLFCGFMIYKSDIGAYYIWVYYSNPFMWTIYGLVTTQMGDVTNEFITVGNNTMSVASYINETFGYEYDFRGWAVLILFGFLVLFRLISYASLNALNFQRR